MAIAGECPGRAGDSTCHAPQLSASACRAALPREVKTEGKEKNTHRHAQKKKGEVGRFCLKLRARPRCETGRPRYRLRASRCRPGRHRLCFPPPPHRPRLCNAPVPRPPRPSPRRRHLGGAGPGRGGQLPPRRAALPCPALPSRPADGGGPPRSCPQVPVPEAESREEKEEEEEGAQGPPTAARPRRHLLQVLPQRRLPSAEPPAAAPPRGRRDAGHTGRRGREASRNATTPPPPPPPPPLPAPLYRLLPPEHNNNKHGGARRAGRVRPRSRRW